MHTATERRARDEHPQQDMGMSYLNKLIDAIPTDADNVNELVAQVMSIIDAHISEIYSPPRITRLCKQHGLKASTAYDATVCDENGLPWNFDDPQHRKRAKRRIIQEQPALLVGSPMCTPFSTLMNLNKHNMDPAKWDALYQWALRHILFCLELYRIQLRAGRHVLHEHPNSASSWHLPELLQ